MALRRAMQKQPETEVRLNPTVHFPEIYGNPPRLPCPGGYGENLSDGTPEEANGDQKKNGDHKRHGKNVIYGDQYGVHIVLQTMTSSKV